MTHRVNRAPVVGGYGVGFTFDIWSEHLYDRAICVVLLIPHSHGQSAISCMLVSTCSFAAEHTADEAL